MHIETSSNRYHDPQQVMLVLCSGASDHWRTYCIAPTAAPKPAEVVESPSPKPEREASDTPWPKQKSQDHAWDAGEECAVNRRRSHDCA